MRQPWSLNPRARRVTALVHQSDTDDRQDKREQAPAEQRHEGRRNDVSGQDRADDQARANGQHPPSTWTMPKYVLRRRR